MISYCLDLGLLLTHDSLPKLHYLFGIPAASLSVLYHT